MPRTDIRKMDLTCDFCGYSEVYDYKSPFSLEKLHKWVCLVRADAPSYNPQEGGADPRMWFDSSACVTSHFERERRAESQEAKVQAAAGASAGVCV